MHQDNINGITFNDRPQMTSIKIVPFFCFSSGAASPRTELLHNLDQGKDYVGETMYSNTFNTQVRAALRMGKWKLLTGDPSMFL